MQNAGFAFKQNMSVNEQKGVAQNGQMSQQALAEAKMQASQQSLSIFSKNKGSSDVNQSNTNSSGTGGVGNIFMGGVPAPSGFDNTSIFTGMNKGSQYSLFSKKDGNFDVPKLTQEDVANQKAAEGPKRTNPKPYNIDMTPKTNPYQAFRNPDMQEPTLGEAVTNTFAGIAALFNQKKAD